jgi:hypothetical protein
MRDHSKRLSTRATESMATVTTAKRGEVMVDRSIVFALIDDDLLAMDFSTRAVNVVLLQTDHNNLSVIKEMIGKYASLYIIEEFTFILYGKLHLSSPDVRGLAS